MIKQIIAWDLGGTKCAAGIVEYDSDTQIVRCKKKTCIKLADTTSLLDLIRKLESDLDFSFSQSDAICIGAAGCFNGTQLIHTNIYPYPLPIAEIACKEKWPAFAVIHDYASIVCATFTDYGTDEAHVKTIHAGESNLYGRRVAFGLGTGLGLKDGVLFQDGQFWLGQNEIGHIGITTAPSADITQQQRHNALMQFLQAHNTNITFEKILSGPGTLQLHQFFYPTSDVSTPEQVRIRLQENQAPELLAAFAWYVGLFVGTVQLSFMPSGGIWISGGVTSNHLNLFDLPDFKSGIHASSAYLSERELFPIRAFFGEDHALIGAGYYAGMRLLA